jgi:arginyl-tRNA synthetase
VTSTYDALLARLQPAFDSVLPDADPVLRPSDRSDYQVNGVMAVAKSLGEVPRDVAERVLAALDMADLAEATVAGPGFINLTLTTSFLSAQLSALFADSHLGVTSVTGRTAVIDYSAPNVAKEMHVGHLRSTVIGDSLARLYRFKGYTVIARNHVGDWGTPFGMLIEHLLDLGEDAAIASLNIGDLNAFYKAAREKFDADDAFKERSRLRVVALQAGDDETRRLWQILVAESVAYFTEVYRALDVTLTPEDVVGESFYNPMLPAVVADLDAAGLLVESDGALCVFPEGFATREGEPLPVIVQKRDEGFGYAATDLAAVRDRIGNLGGTDLLYVVGAPQAQHFAMVWAVAKAAGWIPDDVRIEHIAFGSVLGPDRKVFKTRSGETIKLIHLLNEAVDKADAALLARNADLSDDDRRTLATQIGRAAIKYADLSSDRQRDYVFDIDRMVAFEGDTGPYLQYAYARLRSIARRAGQDIDTPLVPFTLSTPAERLLALGLLGFPEAVDAAVAHCQPHRLAGYLFDLAQRFTSFYDACPVLNAEEATRLERLALCELTARTLRVGLSLLGIEAPEQM